MCTFTNRTAVKKKLIFVVIRKALGINSLISKATFPQPRNRQYFKITFGVKVDKEGKHIYFKKKNTLCEGKLIITFTIRKLVTKKLTKKSKKGGRKKKKREKSMEERITGTFKSVLSILRTKILSQLLDLSSRNVITMRKTYKQSMNTHLPYLGNSSYVHIV